MKKVILMLVLAVTLAIVPIVEADTILTRSAKSIRGVKIVSFKKAKLEIIRKDGKRSNIPYYDIALIRVDGKPGLNRAEQLLMRKSYELAAREYHKVAKDKTWISIWSRVRWMNTIAKTNNVRKVAKIYIDLANQIPSWVITVAPTRRNIKADKFQLASVGRMLIDARDKSSSAKTREALVKFYKQLGCEEKLPPAPKRQIGLNVKKMDQPGPWFDRWAKEKLNKGKADEVMEVADNLFKKSNRRNLPILLYWQGRAMFSKSQFDNAGIKFVRVVIEFPASEYAPFALFYAGRSAEKAGRIEYAQKLYQELVGKFTHSNDFKVMDIIEKAREAVEEMTKD